MVIREETPADPEAIDRVVSAAFGRRDEANLVKALRQSGDAVLSLVAAADGSVDGYVLFSKLAAPAGALALAPLAVAPARQKRGIGAKLVEAGLERVARRGWGAVFLLGDPAYYSRFGFRLETAEGFETPYPPHHFMALELVPGSLTKQGPVVYPAPFTALD